MRLPDHMLKRGVTTNFPSHVSGTLSSSRLLPSIIPLMTHSTPCKGSLGRDGKRPTPGISSCCPCT